MLPRQPNSGENEIEIVSTRKFWGLQREHLLAFHYFPTRGAKCVLLHPHSFASSGEKQNNLPPVKCRAIKYYDSDKISIPPNFVSSTSELLTSILIPEFFIFSLFAITIRFVAVRVVEGKSFEIMEQHAQIPPAAIKAGKTFSGCELFGICFVQAAIEG